MALPLPPPALSDSTKFCISGKLMDGVTVQNIQTHRGPLQGAAQWRFN